jgi:hypothetical protein
MEYSELQSRVLNRPFLPSLPSPDNGPLKAGHLRHHLSSCRTYLSRTRTPRQHDSLRVIFHEAGRVRERPAFRILKTFLNCSRLLRPEVNLGGYPRSCRVRSGTAETHHTHSHGSFCRSCSRWGSSGGAWALTAVLTSHNSTNYDVQVGCKRAQRRTATGGPIWTTGRTPSLEPCYKAVPLIVSY